MALCTVVFRLRLLRWLVETQLDQAIRISRAGFQCLVLHESGDTWQLEKRIRAIQ